MSFIAPEFLYTLCVLIFPILIHLFNFRRFKTVYFSQVRFLKSIKQQTQSTSKLKHFLVLITRCLALVALVLAFAQPYIHDTSQQTRDGKKGVSVYIDNSFSMLSNAEEGTLLEVAKAKAKSIAEAYSASDRFQLLSNEFSASQQRWLNREDFILSLQEVKPSPIFKTLAQVQNRINQTANEEQLKIERFILSDLQKVSIDFLSLTDSNNYYILPIQSQENRNLNLSDIQFSTPYHLPNQLEEIEVTVKNETELEALKLPTQLYLNGKLKSPFTIDFPEQDSVKAQITYRNQASNQLKGKITIKDFPVTFDDTLYFSYPIQNQIHVISIFEELPNPNLEALFKNDSLINYESQSIKQLNYTSLSQCQLIILEDLTKLSSAVQQMLKKFIENGGSLVIFPNAEMEVQNFNALLTQMAAGTYESELTAEATVSSINQKSILFRDVFDELPNNLQLPKVNSHWKISARSQSLVEKIMTYRDGSTFLSAYTVNKGKLYLSSVGLNKEQSNITNHALFVPLLYNMALQSGVNKPTYYNLNQGTFSVPMLSQKESPVHIKGNGLDFIPMQKYRQNLLNIELKNEITQAGHYQLIQEDKVIGEISFNYSRKESKLESYTLSEFEELAKIQQLNFQLIDEKLDVLRSKIEKLDQGTALWKYFIILALIFVAIEILLLRLLK